METEDRSASLASGAPATEHVHEEVRQRPSAGNHLVELDDAECLARLTAGVIGRISLTAGALPVVLPVNYVLRGHAVIASTDAGLKLDAARAGQVACVEVDDWDGFDHTGWYVTATGRLSEITDTAELEWARRLPLRPWRQLVDAHHIRLDIELLGGRRLTHQPPALSFGQGTLER